jgi:hypothetical protein
VTSSPFLSITLSWMIGVGSTGLRSATVVSASASAAEAKPESARGQWRSRCRCRGHSHFSPTPHILAWTGCCRIVISYVLRMQSWSVATRAWRGVGVAAIDVVGGASGEREVTADGGSVLIRTSGVDIGDIRESLGILVIGEPGREWDGVGVGRCAG